MERLVRHILTELFTELKSAEAIYGHDTMCQVFLTFLDMSCPFCVKEVSEKDAASCHLWVS